MSPTPFSSSAGPSDQPRPPPWPRAPRAPDHGARASSESLRLLRPPFPRFPEICLLFLRLKMPRTCYIIYNSLPKEEKSRLSGFRGGCRAQQPPRPSGAPLRPPPSPGSAGHCVRDGQAPGLTPGAQPAARRPFRSVLYVFQFVRHTAARAHVCKSH